MQHLAIMRKSWGLTKKILSGEKIIESRWYKTKYPPYDRIKSNDIVYFKDSGCPVAIRARVSDVKQFSNLTPKKVKQILSKYGKKDGLGLGDIPKYLEMFKGKKYCILIFLKGAEVIKPFHVNKKGHGAMASWICLNSINDIKIRQQL